MQTVLPDMLLEFGHERLAEPHHFVVRFAFRVEIRTSFSAAHRQRSETVLESLLESEELQDREVHRRMESQSALVGADGAVHLYAVAAVDFDFAPVVEPRHTEDDDAFRFGDAFQNLHFLQRRTRHDVRSQRFGYLADGLMEFRFARVAGDEAGHEILDVLVCLFVHGVWF